MLKYAWSEEKNNLLKSTRNICFEQIVEAIESNKSIISLPHPNQEKYKDQRIFVIIIDGYMYAVPYVQDKQVIFLKTIFASRKYQKKYNKKRK